MPRPSGSLLAPLFLGIFAISVFVLFVMSGAEYLSGEKVPGVALGQSTSTHSARVPGSAPSITALSINNASSITLIANATQTVTVNFSVSDGNGCGGIFYSGRVTSTLYRSGVSASCGVSNPTVSSLSLLNCYLVATTTHNCPSANSTNTTANATATYDIWYFAEATDAASSSYPSENWRAYVTVRDDSGLTDATTTPAANGVELNTLLSVHVTTGTLNYGIVNPGQNTSGTNQIAPIKNAGNASATLQLQGTAMCSGGNCMATSSQHYATSTFTYGGAEQALQSAATAVGGWLARPLSSLSWSTSSLPLYHNDLYGIAAAAYNGFLYAIAGGTVGNMQSSTRFASIQQDGSIGAWQETTYYPSTLTAGAAVARNGHLYVFGGDEDEGVGKPTSTVRRAPIHATGSIGVWQTLSSLPNAIAGFGFTTHDQYLYIGGGYYNSTDLTSTIVYASMSPTGTISSWSQAGVLPGEATNNFYNMSLAAGQGYMYLAGDGWPSEQTTTVYYAPISSTGSLGPWLTSSPMVFPSWDNRLVYNDGLLYWFGGNEVSTTSVQFAPILANGKPGAWSLHSNRMPVGYTGVNNGKVIYNGTFYFVAGHDFDPSDGVRNHAPLPSRNTYWGLGVSAGTPTGTYSGVNTFTAVFSP